MIPQNIRELLNQPLGNWTIVNWYSALTSNSSRTVYFTTRAGSEDSATEQRSIREVLVLTNGTVHFVIGNGNKIEQFQLCRYADEKAAEQIKLCRQALQKLTPRERVLLGYPSTIEEESLCDAMAKLKQAKLTSAQRQLLSLPDVNAEAQERRLADLKIGVEEKHAITYIFGNKLRRKRLLSLNNEQLSPSQQ